MRGLSRSLPSFRNKPTPTWVSPAAYVKPLASEASVECSLSLSELSSLWPTSVINFINAVHQPKGLFFCPPPVITVPGLAMLRAPVDNVILNDQINAIAASADSAEEFVRLNNGNL